MKDSKRDLLLLLSSVELLSTEGPPSFQLTDISVGANDCFSAPPAGRAGTAANGKPGINNTTQSQIIVVVKSSKSDLNRHKSFKNKNNIIF